MEKQNYNIVFNSNAMSGSSEHIRHYGVKGMKWDVVKRKDPVPTQTARNPLHASMNPKPRPTWTPTYNPGPQSKPTSNSGSNHKIPKRDAIGDAKQIADLLKAFNVTDPRRMDDDKKNMVRNWVNVKTWDLPNEYAIKYRKDFEAEMKKLGYDVSAVLDGSQQGSSGHGPYGPSGSVTTTQPNVSQEYLDELAFNSQTNNGSSSHGSSGSTTSNSSAAHPNGSSEYQAELAFNSQTNDWIKKRRKR